MTGVSFMNVELAGKRLGLLGELMSDSAHFVALINKKSDLTDRVIKDATAAASTLKRRIEFVYASSITELDSAIAGLGPNVGMMVAPDALFTNRRSQIVALAALHRVPAIYYDREFVESGGLMSYGTSLGDMYRQTGVYTALVLKGTKPADLPVWTPTKYELIVNLKTIKALGLTISDRMLVAADMPIE